MIIIAVTLLWAYGGFELGLLLGEIHTYGLEYVVEKNR